MYSGINSLNFKYMCSYLNKSTSSWKLWRINLKIIKSPKTAPIPAKKPAKKIFKLEAKTKRIAVAIGLVNPYTNKIPAKKAPKYPKDTVISCKKSKEVPLNKIYVKININSKIINLGYLIFRKKDII